MKVTYDRETDSLIITLRDQRIRESNEVKPGVIADFGYDGGIVRFEVLRLRGMLRRQSRLQFAVAAWNERERHDGENDHRR